MPVESRLQTLLQLSHALSSSLELDEVLHRFVNRIVDFTEASSAMLLFWDHERDALLSTGARRENPRGGDPPLVWPLAESPGSRQVLESRHALLVTRADRDRFPAEVAMLDRFEVQTVLLVPLVARTEALGVVAIADERLRTFSDEDIEFCEAVCAIAATAVRNARLFEEMRELALRDQMTGLYNRRAFKENLVAALARGGRSGEPVALVALDLDGLKAINDTGGHHAGDAALRAAAEALRRATRAGDIACRLGGDEFAVILPGATEEAAAVVARRAQDHLGALTGGGCTFSAGVAASDDADDADDLHRRADAAAYRAKQAGGGRTVAWHERV